MPQPGCQTFAEAIFEGTIRSANKKTGFGLHQTPCEIERSIATAASTAACAAAAVFTTGTATAAAAAAGRTVFAGTRDVNGQSATAQLRAIQGVNGLLSLLGGAHGDETKAAGTTRGAIHHQVGFGYGAVGGKRVLEFVLSGVKGKIPNEQFITHAILLS
jgi:hypothetical protein